MSNIFCITSVLVIVCLFLIYNTEIIESLIGDKRKTMCNGIDGRCYSVADRNSHKSHTVASDTMAHINGLSIKLLRFMRQKYLYNREGNKYTRDIVIRMLKRYDPESLIENVPYSISNTSYVKNKGDEFAVCLFSSNDEIERIHTLDFVVLHELSHLSTELIDNHDNVFWRHFKFLLANAQEAGLHEPTDYSKYPVKYCGMLDISYNPYFDSTLQPI